MHPFKSYTLTWWQFSLLKTAMIAFGLALGASLPAVIEGWIPLLWVLFIVPGTYLMVVAFKQMQP
jgi:hypothetical protein